MAQGTKTENTAVNRLIEMAHERPLEADDALFSSPSPSSRKPLPPPFPGRIATVAPADPPPPLPRARAPHSTQTHLNAVAPAAVPSVPDVQTGPFDQLDDEALAAAADDDLPITVDDPAATSPAKLGLPPLVIGHVEPLAARPSALGHAPGLEEAAWFDESIASDRVDEAVLGTEGVARGGGRAKTMLWLSAAFAAGLVATAVIVWPMGKSSVAPAPPPPAVAPAPAVAAVEVTPSPAPAAVAPAAVAPAVVAAPAAEPAVAEPAVVEPTAPTVVEPLEAPAAPAVVEPAAPTAVRVVLESEPSGATVMRVDENGAQPLGQTPMVYEMEPGAAELMFTMAGHRSSLVTVDPAATKRVTVDLASSTAKVEAPAAPAPSLARVEPVIAAPKAAPKAPKAAPTAAPRAKAEPKAVAKVEPKKAEPKAARVASSGGGGGTLMLGAKPPCDIFIDGKPTGLKTPQRAIKVSPGAHRVTLVSREHKITETFSVDIKAGAPTKIVKDLTRRMK